ncbi:DUF5723 family protein [Marinoscillum sp. MHG1-6]|uniref:DUF5723 family protein n=1 Tax=Marinoscillum sp. MHG1-6 TaxID=2959627 RepID=UPI002157BB95|nr:DUF5723 family protein [Marinoscillum sp. MHG1-6]
MKKLGAVILTLCLSGLSLVHAQTSLSFYQLGGTTFQNSSYNPTHLPDGKIFFGLPVLSGIHLNYNNRLGYSEVIATNPETGNPKIYPRTALKAMGNNNLIRVHSTIGLLHLGVRLNNGLSISAFANERFESDVFFTQQTIKFFVKGNNSLIDQRVEVGKNRANISHFREIGLGVTLPSPDFPVVMGARLKYLQGFTNVSTPGNQSAFVSTSAESYDITGELEGAMLRTSGMDLIGDGSHYGFNKNTGFAVDLGFEWQMNKYNVISGSIVDLGFISWKEDIKNHYLQDTTFSYTGVDLNQLNNVRKTILDTLAGHFKKRSNNNSYTTLLGTKIFASWVYHTPYPGGDVVSSIGTRYLQGKLNTMLGVGYRQRFGNFFVGSVNLTKLPQQFFNIGSSFAVQGGPVQFYMAVDQVVNFDLTKFQAFDARVGINFVIRQRSSGITGGGAMTTFDKNKNDTKRKSSGGAKNQSFMGSKVKVRSNDGIYNVIPKQKRRKKEEYFPNNDPN